MNTLIARVTREGKWWMIEVPGIDGVTQVRRFSDAETAVRELIAVTNGVPIDSFEVVLQVTAAGIPDLCESVREIQLGRKEAARLEKLASERATLIAQTLAGADVPVRDIGAILGISHQRAHQLVTP